MGNRLKNNLGFTLIELLIVVAIIGVVSGIAFPNLLKQLPKWNADGATRDISGKLMQARLKAIQGNKNHAVEFTVGTAGTFRIKKYTGTWDDLGHEGHSASNVYIDIKGTCPDNRAEFYPNGTTSSCSIRVITSDSAWDRRLTLNTSTGNITVKKCEDVGADCDAW